MVLLLALDGVLVLGYGLDLLVVLRLVGLLEVLVDLVAEVLTLVLVDLVVVLVVRALEASYL